MQYFNEGSGERHHDDRINAQMTRRHGHTLRMVPRRAGDYAFGIQEVRGNARNLIVCPSYFVSICLVKKSRMEADSIVSIQAFSIDGHISSTAPPLVRSGKLIGLEPGQ